MNRYDKMLLIRYTATTIRQFETALSKSNIEPAVRELVEAALDEARELSRRLQTMKTDD